MKEFCSVEHTVIAYFAVNLQNEYVEATERVAEKFKLPCVNLQKVFDEELKNAPAEYWSRDGYHPTPMGHGIIAREWLRLFEKFK